MKISLCMITRDEEENLAECLRSAAPHVDEIIVVDTGSVDKTRDVARSFGATVIDWNADNQATEFFIDDEATCRSFGAPPPYSGMIALGNFAGARNASFEPATGDFLLWLDSDDVLEGGENLRALCADMEARKLDVGFLAYNYSVDHAGRVHFRQWRERVIRRGTMSWINPIHEVLLPKGPNGYAANARYETVTITHRRRGDRSIVPNRNLKNLLREYKRVTDAGEEADPRLLFYLGQEIRFVDPAAAVGYYERYLQKSGWGEERAAAHLALGQLYEYGAIPLPLEDSRARAYNHFAVAATEQPDSPDGLFGMARIAYLRGLYIDCITLNERGLRIGNTDTMLGTNPTERVYKTHVYYNHALAMVGRIEDAIKSCEAALAVCPDDPGVPGGAPGMVTLNLAAYRAQLAGVAPPAAKRGELIVKSDEPLDAPPQAIPANALVAWCIQFWKQVRMLERSEQGAAALLDAMPAVVKRDPIWGRMRAMTRDTAPLVTVTVPVDLGRYASFGKLDKTPASRLSDGKKFVLWVGQNIENWGPDAPDTTGIGGSETAAIAVCRGLAARGWDVTVYGCPPREETRDGVRWLRWESFPGVGPDVDVFVSSRDPSVMQSRIEAKVKLLWLHDVDCGPPHAELERWLLRFDRVLCLSQWHKQHLLAVTPTLHPDRVIVTRNGIELERYAAFSLAPRANKMVWSSSPPRGLDMMLTNMPAIRARVPDAELHVYYGFETWEAFARQRPQTGELQEIERYKLALRSTPGVVWHGRVNQRQLAAAQLSAKVWPYITEFTETSCITAMECQAAGAVPVTTRLAALAETVKVGKLIDPSPTYGQEFVDEVVRLLTDEPYWNTQAEWANAEAKRHFSWSALVDEWIGMFAELETDVQRNPIHPWRRAA